MEVALHLHRGDQSLATVTKSGPTHWFTITDKAGNEMTIFIHSELVADADAFAQSINTYCRPPFREVAE
jgi:hypothetical protein